MGIIHGPLDLKMIRDIDEELRTANECFSRAGAVKVAGIDEKVAKAKDVLLKNTKEDHKAELALETMLMTITMEIYGLAGVAHNEIEEWFLLVQWDPCANHLISSVIKR